MESTQGFKPVPQWGETTALKTTQPYCWANKVQTHSVWTAFTSLSSTWLLNCLVVTYTVVSSTDITICTHFLRGSRLLITKACPTSAVYCTCIWRTPVNVYHTFSIESSCLTPVVFVTKTMTTGARGDGWDKSQSLTSLLPIPPCAPLGIGSTDMMTGWLLRKHVSERTRTHDELKLGTNFRPSDLRRKAFSNVIRAMNEWHFISIGCIITGRPWSPLLPLICFILSSYERCDWLILQAC